MAPVSSEAGVQHYMLRNLQVLSVIGLGLILVLAGASTYVVAGWALNPLGDIQDAIRRVDARHLHARVPTGACRDDELHALARSLNGMLDGLQAAFAQQERFVADASHELRTPLALMRTTLDHVLTEGPGNAEAYRQALESLNRSARRLERLANDLLELAAPPLEVATNVIALGPVLEEALGDAADLAHDHGIVVRVSGQADIYVRGHFWRLVRLFSNLLTNAIKYNRPSGSVTVYAERVDDAAVVRVVDTGIGIARDQVATIFDRFARAEPSRSHKGGFGLGLAIVAKIAREHGGAVTVTSTPGQGSEFCVRLPIAGPDSEVGGAVGLS
jgi:signal transduction histidine kinase